MPGAAYTTDDASRAGASRRRSSSLRRVATLPGRGHGVGMATPEVLPAARTACVVVGAAPEQVAAVGTNTRTTLRANKLGTLVTGRPGDLVIDYAAELPGPVYDVMYSAQTGWFSVTVFRGLDPPVRWDNRPGTDPGYTRVGDVLGATSPTMILAALDIPPTALGYHGA
jgi:hypothetical protein